METDTCLVCCSLLAPEWLFYRWMHLLSRTTQELVTDDRRTARSRDSDFSMLTTTSTQQRQPRWRSGGALPRGRAAAGVPSRGCTSPAPRDCAGVEPDTTTHPTLLDSHGPALFTFHFISLLGRWKEVFWEQIFEGLFLPNEALPVMKWQNSRVLRCKVQFRILVRFQQQKQNRKKVILSETSYIFPTFIPLWGDCGQSLCQSNSCCLRQ